MRRWGFLISAVLGALAFPPLPLWPLAYVALVPFLYSATDPAAPKIFWRAWRAGLFFFGGVLYWVGFNSGAPWLLSAVAALALIMILATIWGLAAWAVNRAATSLGVPSAVVLFLTLYPALEVFWGTGELSLPWALWGLTQSSFLPAAQLAELVDVEGLSLWVLSLNALLFLYSTDRRRAYLALALALFVLPVSWGVLRMNGADHGPRLSVAAVQANTPVEDKWQISSGDILMDHVRLTDELPRGDAKLIVWPETATPMPIRFREWALDTLYALSERTGAAILTGATDYELKDGEQRPLNAAFVIAPGSRSLQRAAKIHLVPFGERVPGQKLFPALGKLHLGQAEFLPGDSVVVFTAAGLPLFTTLICFEVIYPEIAAEAVQKGARLFGHITNDGWYGHSSGPYQHLELARLRAIATRRSIVRAANTGVSALILPSGKIVNTIGFNRAGTIVGELALRDDVTLAVRLARIWPICYYGALAVVLALLWMRTRRYGPSPS